MYVQLSTGAEVGDKYELVARGLRVHRLAVWDNGTYECRAEVASHGNVKLRHVTLQVLCTISLHRPSFSRTMCPLSSFFTFCFFSFQFVDSVGVTDRNGIGL